MIITQTPFRMPLGGGGTDLPSYYSKYGGFIISASIDKYMFINVNQPFVDDLVRIHYARQSEVVESADELNHELAREVLRYIGLVHAVEISSMADVPDGTGLGSSGSYIVGLLHGLRTLKRDFVSLQDLAEEGYHIEAEILKRPVGKHDQYLAAFGGLTVLEIEKDGAVHVSKARVSQTTIEEMERNVVIYFTGVSRNSLQILSKQNKATEQDDKQVVNSLHRIKEIGYRIKEAVEDGDLTTFGQLLDQHWKTKKQMSGDISNPAIDEIYDLAKKNGALGGKIMGAGGGGFFMFYCEDGTSRLSKALADRGLREMKYKIDFEGTRVISNFSNHRQMTNIFTSSHPPLVRKDIAARIANLA